MKMIDGSPPELSVVVPVFNEEETIGTLLDEISAACPAAEIIIVNDGSTDRTAEELESWGTSRKQLRVITLEKNSGQGAALYRGLKEARAEIIVTLDGDGQNVPADIPKLLDELRDCDLVVGIRQGRRDSRLRRWMSKIANGVRSRLLGDGVTDSGCAFKAMRRETIDALIPMQTLYSFIPALVAGAGFRVSEIPVTHRQRQGGTSHYSLRKMLWRPLLDMIGVCWFNQRRCRTKENSSAGLHLLPIIAIGMAFFLFLGKHGLLEPDEGRYAQVANEMHASGDLITPTLNGFSHVEKPPVIYWATALSYQLFGVSEFSARLPSTLAALGIILLTYQMCRDLAGRQAAAIAAIVLASSLQFFLMARLITADMLMAFWITAAATCAVKFHHHPERRACRWLFFVFMGIGFLTKGPMAIVVPVAAAAGLAWKNKERPRLPWLVGIPLCLAISSSWFLAISFANPSLFEYFLKTELADRFLSSSHGRSQPFYFFLPVIAVGFMPWIFFLIPAMVKRFLQPNEFGNTTRFLIAYIGIPLLILSASGSKLVTYVLPLFPALAIAMSLCFTKGFLPSRVTIRALGVGAIFLAAALAAWPVVSPGDLRFQPGALSLLAIAMAGALLFLCPRGAKLQQTVTTTALASVIASLAIASQVGQVNHFLGRQASMRQFADVLSEHPGARVIAANIRAHGLEFYIGRCVEVTRGQADLVLPPDEAQSRRLHSSPKRISRLRPRAEQATFVVTRKQDWKKHFGPSSRWDKVDESGDFLLLRLVDDPDRSALTSR